MTELHRLATACSLLEVDHQLHASLAHVESFSESSQMGS